MLLFTDSKKKKKRYNSNPRAEELCSSYAWSTSRKRSLLYAVTHREDLSIHFICRSIERRHDSPTVEYQARK